MAQGQAELAGSQRRSLDCTITGTAQLALQHLKVLGMEGLAGSRVDVWWTNSAHFDGVFADQLVAVDDIVRVCMQTGALMSHRQAQSRQHLRSQVQRWSVTW